eukprot:UN33900
MPYFQLPPFEDRSKEQNRSKEELQDYFSSLHQWIMLKNNAIPANPETKTLESTKKTIFGKKRQRIGKYY